VIKSQYYCDGCGRKLEGKSLDTARDFISTYPGCNELFCPEQCLVIAPDYLSQSRPVIAKILSDAAHAVENYRSKFFASRRPLATKPALKEAVN